MQLQPAPHQDRGTVLFHGTDSAVLYQRNLSTQPVSWPWRDSPVQYTLNSQGYRSSLDSAADWSQVLVLLGCSWAFGVGVTDTAVVAHQLSQQLSRPVFNASQGGTSIRWSCDQFTLMLSQGIRPWAVAAIWTDVARWSWLGSPGPQQPLLAARACTAHLEDPQHAAQRSLYDVMALRQQCELMGRPLAEATWNSHTAAVLSVSPLPDLDRARDLSHPGPLSHSTAATLLTQLIL